MTLITPTLDPLGIIIDPMLGNFNHSCDPNAYIIMDGAEVNVRSLKPIKKDEEIFISYIDTTNPYSRRQHELKQRWFFTCKCTKCQQGPTLDEDKWAIDSQALPQEMQQIAEMMTKNESFTSDPANYAGDSKIERYIATLQGKLAKFAMMQDADLDKRAASAAHSDVADDAVQLLTLLGHKRAEAERMVHEAISTEPNAPDAESLVRVIYRKQQEKK